mmetsp:Transcript_14907/g.41061  ORF Transcript_14907/g.41061 Transcript_14907/m.41061 type:complete len:204 (-) Transcript_14907:647-1258(-)
MLQRFTISGVSSLSLIIFRTAQNVFSDSCDESNLAASTRRLETGLQSEVSNVRHSSSFGARARRPRRSQCTASNTMSTLIGGCLIDLSSTSDTKVKQLTASCAFCISISAEEYLFTAVVSISTTRSCALTMARFALSLSSPSELKRRVRTGRTMAFTSCTSTEQCSRIRSTSSMSDPILVSLLAHMPRKSSTSVETTFPRNIS